MSIFYQRFMPAFTPDSTSIALTPSRTAKASYFYLQTAGHYKALPAYYTDRQGLNSYMILYTNSGRGYLKYRNKDYFLMPGSVFFINCAEPQFYNTVGNEIWDSYGLHFMGATTAGYYNQFASDDVYAIGCESNEAISSLVRSIFDQNVEMKPENELITSQLLLELMTQLILTKHFSNNHELCIPNYINDMLLHIEMYFRQDLTLDYLSKYFSVSKSHMCREFKKFTGFSPNEYIIHTRMANAKELLKFSEKTVEEIALESGFNYVSHFIQTFRAREGTTPSVFRKNWQEQSNHKSEESL